MRFNRSIHFRTTSIFVKKVFFLSKNKTPQNGRKTTKIKLNRLSPQWINYN